MPYYCKTCRFYKWHKYENPENRGFHYCERLNNATQREDMERNCGGQFYQITEPPAIKRMQPAVRLLLNVYNDNEETQRVIIAANANNDAATIKNALDGVIKYVRTIKKQLDA